MILGTAAYMSPEQARGKAVDKRTDIWAFGCVLYEMLAGRAAFARDTVTDTLVAVIEERPDWQTLPASTPPHIVRLLRRCLEKDGRRRLKDIGDAALDIDDVLAEPRAKPPVRISRWSAAWRSRGLTTTLASVAVRWVDCRGGNRGQRATAELGGNQRCPTVRVPAATDSAFGGGVLDRTPSFAISPDGRRVVFAASSPGIGHRFWLRPLDALTRIRSPAGRRGVTLLVTRRSLGGFFADGKLKRVNLAGGAPLTIADASSGLEALGTDTATSFMRRHLKGPCGVWRRPEERRRRSPGSAPATSGMCVRSFFPMANTSFIWFGPPHRAAASMCRHSTQPSRDTLSPHANGPCTLRAICCSSARGDCSGSRSMQRGWSCQAMRFLWSIQSPLFRRKDARRTTCRTTAR